MASIEIKIDLKDMAKQMVTNRTKKRMPSKKQRAASAIMKGIKMSHQWPTDKTGIPFFRASTEHSG